MFCYSHKCSPFLKTLMQTDVLNIYGIFSYFEYVHVWNILKIRNNISISLFYQFISIYINCNDICTYYLNLVIIPTFDWGNFNVVDCGVLLQALYFNALYTYIYIAFMKFKIKFWILNFEIFLAWHFSDTQLNKFAMWLFIYFLSTRL